MPLTQHLEITLSTNQHLLPGSRVLPWHVVTSRRQWVAGSCLLPNPPLRTGARSADSVAPPHARWVGHNTSFQHSCQKHCVFYFIQLQGMQRHLCSLGKHTLSLAKYIKSCLFSGKIRPRIQINQKSTKPLNNKCSPSQSPALHQPRKDVAVSAGMDFYL